MARKRKRYQRSDVPRKGPLRFIGGLIALVIVAALVVGGGSYLWCMANIGSNMEDRSIEEALANQADPGVPDGYAAVDSQVTNYLIFGVANPAMDSNTLLSVQLVSVNSTTGVTSIVELPVNMKVVPTETSYALSNLYAAYGVDTSSAAVAKALNLHIDHVLVVKTNWMSQIGELDGNTMLDLMRNPRGFVSSVVSDMGKDELLEFIGVIQDAGGSMVAVEVTSNDEDSESGVMAVVDSRGLNVALGTLQTSSGE